jgi:hypothetical protein
MGLKKYPVAYLLHKCFFLNHLICEQKASFQFKIYFACYFILVQI